MRIQRFLLVLLGCGLLGCEDNGAAPGDGDTDADEFAGFDFQLDATYAFPENEAPKLIVDLESASAPVDVQDLSVEVLSSEPRVQIAVNNVKFRDGQSAYAVTDIKTGEYRSTTESYFNDSENALDFDFSQSNSIVVVLDVSSSLGEQVDEVKEFAKSFVSTVLTDSIGTTEVAVVGFSGFVAASEFSSTEASVHSFIDALEEGINETKLYQAIGEGVDLIESRTDVDGRALLVFTDGANNSWDSTDFEFPDLVTKELDQLNDVNLFVIGFEGTGDVDPPALRRLAMDSTVEFPRTAGDLDRVFKRFARQISSLYRFVYDRNKSRTSTAKDLRFYFKAERIQ